MRFRTARVERVFREEDRDLTKISVNIGKESFQAVSFDSLTGPVSQGDEVIVNTSAVDLDLGSGGVHFVLWNLSNKGFETEAGGHIVKMRYTPLQLPVLSVEEQDSPHHGLMSNTELFGMPCIAGSLHSQLAPIVLTIKAVSPETKVAYIMTDGGALPVAFSDTVHHLKRAGLLETTITAGQSFGGDLEAINIYSALIAAKDAAKADIAIILMGPGIVGTSTPLGFSGIEQGQIINAIHSLGGIPIAVPRISFKEERERHYGLSHHFITSLTKVALAKSTIVLSDMEPDEMAIVMKRIVSNNLASLHRIEMVKNDVTIEAIKESGFKVSTMGRGIDEEPAFFKTAGSAGLYALSLLGVRI